MLVELENVSKDYYRGKNRIPAVRNVCLEMDSGDYVAIMGPSGSGKTTLLNLLGCLDVPSSGEYRLDGVQINGMSDNELAEVRNHQIGFVFQDFCLLPQMNVLENVALPLLYAGVPRKMRRQMAREALEKVGISDRADFLPGQLSGGQCQRAAIARAIVGSPEILLADEPTGSLDTETGEQIMEVFRRLNADGMTILMITHDPGIAACARRTYHLLDGKLWTGEEEMEGIPNEEA